MKKPVFGVCSLLLLLTLACCLVLGGFTSPAAAKTIVVTTLDDIANPPFDADGPCGTGTISDLPGVDDDKVSLREAIIAANNTKGKQTITFAPSLSGGTIVVTFDDLDGDTNPDPLPALCGGQTRIKGDLDDDDVPDVTLEGAAIPVVAPPVAAAGLLIISCHNTINGLRVQHFPFGIVVQAGDFPTPGTPGTVAHTTVKNNIVTESSFHGIFVLTGDAPGSVLAHTTLTHNLVMQNAQHGILVLANLSGAGSDTRIHHPIITDNEVTGNEAFGIFLLSLGDHNVVSNATLARNTVSGNTFAGIVVWGGFGGADENTLDVDVKNNTVTDSRFEGIGVFAGRDNSSHNRVVARIRGNTLERHQIGGIETGAAIGAAEFPTGTSNNNVLDIRIEGNTVRSQTGEGIFVGGADGFNDGGVANGNQTMAIVMHNTIEDNTYSGITLTAGGVGQASSNTLDVRVAHNTVCNNTGADIIGEGGYSGGNILFPAPNLGTGNMLIGRIFHNTATMVTVADGVPGNTADVKQFKNEPCP